MTSDGHLISEPRSTWAPVALEAVLAGEVLEPHPSILRRTDAECLLYERRVHALHAEPEALKTWLGLRACVEVLRDGETVLYIDFEDYAPSIVQRLRNLGLSTETIAAGFVYIRPDEALTPETIRDLDAALASNPTLAVVDGVTEAYSRQGLNPLDNSDVATWLNLLPRQLAQAGAAVLMLDHVVKDREQRGRYALGAQHKLAGVDVAYSLRVIEPFSRQHDGLVSIKVEKDRPGHVRAFAQDGIVAVLRASTADGRVRIRLEPPAEQAARTFRPTRLMEHISAAVEDKPGLSKRAIREAVRGTKDGTKDLALELLITEGYIEARRDGQAHRHYSLKPYREDADSEDRGQCGPTVAEPWPATGESDRGSVAHPLKGATATDTPQPDTPQANRGPIAVDDDPTRRLQRLQHYDQVGAQHLAELLHTDVTAIVTEPEDGGLTIEQLLEAFPGSTPLKVVA